MSAKSQTRRPAAAVRAAAVLLTLIFAAVFLVFPLGAYAEDVEGDYYGTGTVEDLKAYYEENGWPEEVSFVYDDGDTITVGVIDTSDSVLESICSLVESGRKIVFEKCDFSHSYLVETRDEILTLYSEKGVISAELAEDDDKVDVLIDGDSYTFFMYNFSSVYGSVCNFNPDGEVSDWSDALGGDGATIIVMFLLIVIFVVIAVIFNKYKEKRRLEKKREAVAEQRLRDKGRYSSIKRT
ncbi:MAG: hypothetical protein ACOX6J_00665 [Oscillospiraceae bacterium]|jgi:hypothetical protein